MTRKKPTTMGRSRHIEVPNWASPLIAAILAFVATWGALRVTVASLQDDVQSLKALVQTVVVLDATVKAQDAEQRRLRDNLNELASKQQNFAERMAKIEAVMSTSR